MRRLLPLAALGLIIVLAFAARMDWGNVSAQEAAGGVAVKSLPGCTDNTLPANDDGSTGLVGLPFTPNFFGTQYTQLYVNNNGNVTFDGALAQFTPENIVTTSHVIIAPFFADVDTRGAGSGLVTYGNTTFSNRTTFCVNWVNVGYYNSHTDKLNSFQLLLVDRSDVGVGDFDMIFNYNQIQWETGDASSGTNGLGGFSARAGYSNGVDTSLELPGSAVNGAFLDGSPSGLANNSRDSTVVGRYIFRVRNGSAPTGGSIAGNVFGNETGSDVGLGGAFVQACFAATPAPPCQVTTTNLNGDYVFTGLPGGGNYFVTAFPPAGAEDLGPRTIGALFMPPEGADLVDQDIKLLASRPVPPGVTIDTPFQAGDGTPAVSSTTGAPFRQTGACPGGTGTWSITQNGVILSSGNLTETDSGKYKGTIPPMPGRNGRAGMKITIDCPSPTPDQQKEFDIYIDPSGNVLDTLGDPIEDATVTLLRSDSSAGPFDPVPDGNAIMSPSNRTNPDMTDAEGFFRWDVIAGFYKVRAEKPGCHDPLNEAQPFVETDVLEVPPPAFDLVLTLNCGEDGPIFTPTRTRTATPTRTPTPEGVCGDVNGNGTVDSIDAAVVLQFSAGLINSVPRPGNADPSRDGDINSIDSALILQRAAGLVNQLTC